MSTVPFDTYRFRRRLIDAGLPEKQAQELVIGATEAAENLATKADLKMLEQQLTIKLAAIIVGAVAVVPSLIKLLGWAA